MAMVIGGVDHQPKGHIGHIGHIDSPLGFRFYSFMDFLRQAPPYEAATGGTIIQIKQQGKYIVNSRFNSGTTMTHLHSSLTVICI